MASVKRCKSGSFEIRFFVETNVRKSFYPGRKATKKQAESIGAKLDKLVFAVRQSDTPSPDVAEWLTSLTDKQHAKLAAWGLVRPRAAAVVIEPYQETLGEWIKRYLGRGTWKPGTLDQLEVTATNLRTFFGADKPLRAITPGDAEDFRIWLQTRARGTDKEGNPVGLAHNTVRRRIGRTKQMFSAAAKRELIPTNPFTDEAAATGANVERHQFIPAEWIERCIKVVPGEDWKIILAFARYAGMRSHETRIQRWDDIDIPNRRMIVRSHKTPPTRVCPLFPELLPHLMRAREMAPSGAEFVQSRYESDANIQTELVRIIDKAGLSRWPDVMQNLRRSRETELMAHYPVKDVAGWIGNSVPVAMKHYAMAMEDSFAKAIIDGAGGVEPFGDRSGCPRRTGTGPEKPAKDDAAGHFTPDSTPGEAKTGELLQLWEAMDEAERGELLSAARHLAARQRTTEDSRA